MNELFLFFYRSPNVKSPCGFDILCVCNSCVFVEEPCILFASQDVLIFFVPSFLSFSLSHFISLSPSLSHSLFLRSDVSPIFDKLYIFEAVN